MRWLLILSLAILSGCVQFEGYSPTAYHDPVNKLTICHGHRLSQHERKTYTRQECEAIRIADTAKAIGAVYKCAKPLSSGQVIAFTDLAYNLGSDRFCKSSVARLSREGELFESCRELNRFVNAGGRRLRGLVRRRSYYSDICGRWLWPEPLVLTRT